MTDPESNLHLIRHRVSSKLDELRILLEEVDRELNAEDHFYLSKAVESLTFYGTGDEGIELFSETCSVAYQMSGIGERWQAMLMVLFAEEQAVRSYEFRDNDEDYTTGSCGY